MSKSKKFLIALVVILTAALITCCVFLFKPSDNADASSYGEIITELEDQIEALKTQGFQDKATIDEYTKKVNDALGNLDLANKDKARLQRELEEAKRAALEAYERNYLEGYHNGYEYGLALGSGKINEWMKNYINANFLSILKTFNDVEALNQVAAAFVPEERGTAASLATGFNTETDFTKFKLIISTVSGVKAYDCKNLKKTTEQVTWKDNPPGQMVAITNFSDVDTYTLTFSTDAEILEFSLSHILAIDGPSGYNLTRLEIESSSIPDGLINVYICKKMEVAA